MRLAGGGGDKGEKMGLWGKYNAKGYINQLCLKCRQNHIEKEVKINCRSRLERY